MSDLINELSIKVIKDVIPVCQSLSQVLIDSLNELSEEYSEEDLILIADRVIFNIITNLHNDVFHGDETASMETIATNVRELQALLLHNSLTLSGFSIERGQGKH